MVEIKVQYRYNNGNEIKENIKLFDYEMFDTDKEIERLYFERDIAEEYDHVYRTMLDIYKDGFTGEVIGVRKVGCLIK